MKCECYAKTGKRGGQQIFYCRLHRSAPRLKQELRLCMRLLSMSQPHGVVGTDRALLRAVELIRYIDGDDCASTGGGK